MVKYRRLSFIAGYGAPNANSAAYHRISLKSFFTISRHTNGRSYAGSAASTGQRKNLFTSFSGRHAATHRGYDIEIMLMIWSFGGRYDEWYEALIRDMHILMPAANTRRYYGLGSMRRWRLQPKAYSSIYSPRLFMIAWQYRSWIITVFPHAFMYSPAYSTYSSKLIMSPRFHKANFYFKISFNKKHRYYFDI